MMMSLCVGQLWHIPANPTYHESVCLIVSVETTGLTSVCCTAHIVAYEGDETVFAGFDTMHSDEFRGPGVRLLGYC